MSITWSSYLGKSPVLYSSKVLRETGLRHPPFCERIIADCLGLKIIEFTSQDVEAFQAQNPDRSEIFEHLRTACAWLHKDDESAVVCVNADMPVERKRLSIVHEGGHSLMPWHQDVDYLCGSAGIDSTTMRRIEREAFTCGSAFLMPPKHFIEDMLSLDTSLASMRQLANRYVTSFEATAIWYASVHPGYCGFLVAEPSPVITGDSSANLHQLVLPFETSISNVIVDASYQLTVKYFVGSNPLPMFVRPGTVIAERSPIHQAWVAGKHVQGDMYTSALGSSAAGERLRVDCEPWGGSCVVALLWVPDPRVGINFGPGVYA